MSMQASCWAFFFFLLSRMFGLFGELSCLVSFICNCRALWFHLGAKGQQMTAGNAESPFICLKANFWSQWHHCLNSQWVYLFQVLTLCVLLSTDYSLYRNATGSKWEYVPFLYLLNIVGYLSQGTDSQLIDRWFLSLFFFFFFLY